MDVPKLVLDRSDALLTLGVGAIDEDEVNEVSLANFQPLFLRVAAPLPPLFRVSSSYG